VGQTQIEEAHGINLTAPESNVYNNARILFSQFRCRSYNFIAFTTYNQIEKTVRANLKIPCNSRSFSISKRIAKVVSRTVSPLFSLLMKVRLLRDISRNNLAHSLGYAAVPY
jgi:hypothetical protein